MDDPFSELFKVLVEKLDAQDALVLATEDGLGRIRACTTGIAQDTSWPTTGPLARALQGQVVLIGDCSDVPALRELTDVQSGRVTSVVCASLAAPSQAGLLLCTHENRNQFGHLHSRVFERLAPLAGQALERFEARDRERALLNQTRKQNEALKAEIEERTRAEQKLQDAQRQLLQSEKLSSLGRLVAGMAHEINTPLGVAFTASSVIGESLKELETLHENRALTRRDLNRCLSAANDAVSLTTQNLERAAEFIANFKEVSVDRHSQKWRRVELAGYLRQVITTLHPIIGKSQVAVTVQSSGPIKLTTLPGALAQIVTNLVQNAVVHAFDPGCPGNVVFDCNRQGDQVTLMYTDDGKGMTQEVLSSAFYPFFTTQQGAGGSGLGLFIVHELVTGPLSGNITLHSTSGSGTKITISWPMRTTPVQ